MNIKSLRKVLKVAKTTVLTPGILTNGLKNHTNVEGILATVLECYPYGENCMLTPAGGKIYGILPVEDYDTLGLPQVFPARLVWGAAGVSDKAQEDFALFETVSWLTLDKLSKDDLERVLEYTILVEEQRLLETLSDFVQFSNLGDVSIFLMAYLGFKHGQRVVGGTTELADKFTLRLMRELGLYPITANTLHKYRYALELSQEQLGRLSGGEIENWSELSTYFLLTKEQISTLCQIMAEIGQFSPKSQSRMAYYIKEMLDKIEKNPQSFALNNGICATERYLNLPPSRAMIETDKELKVMEQDIQNLTATLANPTQSVINDSDYDYWFT
jgi:hypothetical protein